MLPPKYPRSPRDVINYQDETHVSVPYPNNQRRNSNSKQKNRFSGNLTSLDSKSKVSKYQHIRSPQQKKKALGKRRYINQLAYLDYEDKYIQIHTKYTMASKVSALKKIKAKNQMAEFIQQEEQQVGFEQLMDYKYGPQSNNENFFFEKNQLISEYKFCKQCDSIHNDHPEVHNKICKDKIFQYEGFDKKDQNYVYLSLQRIQIALKRTSGQQYDTLKEIVKNLIRIQQKSINPMSSKLQTQSSELQKQLKYLYQLYKVNYSENILKDICQKIMKQLYRRNIK